MGRYITTWACISFLVPVLVLVADKPPAVLIVLLLMVMLVLNLFLKYNNPRKLDRFVRFVNDSILMLLMVRVVISSAIAPALANALSDVLAGSALIISINGIYFLARTLYIKIYTRRAMSAVDKHDELYELAVFGGEREVVEYIKFCHKHELNNQLKQDCK